MFVPSLLWLALQAPGAAAGPLVPTRTVTLPNGMTVVLHEDHSLPTVAINTWFAVGSKDEAPGRTGFAHLFEHLMFMGTTRVPDNQFDVLMESGGGANNASTSTDRTNYYSSGPSSLLPTLLWLDADRLDGLADAMTQEKLDLQRGVVRNERRQTSENVPYGKAELLLPELLYPAGHPYHHSVIGSHEDLEAATLEDVVGFFRTHYVPANASLVVAGDFDADAALALIERTFGAIPARPAPERLRVPPVRLERETRFVTTDDVEFPKLFLVWHSPAELAPGDAELELLARILADGPSSRLYRRLVLERQIAQEVDAAQLSQELGSLFQIEALAAPGADLEEIRHEILAVLEELGRGGPSAEELERARTQREAGFLAALESLAWRADQINLYRHYWGVSDGFRRDLERAAHAAPADLARLVREHLGEGKVDLRILPEGAAVAAASLDERPADLPRRAWSPPEPRTLRLANGIELHALERPGSGLFAGALVVRGGDALLAPEQAGLAELCARMLLSGAGGLDAAAFAAAVDDLGASVDADAGVADMTLSVRGLSSRLAPTLERFAQLALEPRLDAADFAREHELLRAEVAARADDPRRVSGVVANALLLGRDAPGGRPLSGWSETVLGLTPDDVTRALPLLLDPSRASFVFVGDFRAEALRDALDARFGRWRAAERPVAASAPRVPVAAPEDLRGKLVLVDRPGAPQTTILVTRPVETLEGVARAVRAAVNTALGGSFTSRLNQNLRERNAFTYGAGSRLRRQGEVTLFAASTAVFRDKTGPALVELKGELERLAREGLPSEEVSKALERLRTDLVDEAETTGSLARAFQALVREGRPLDALATELAELERVDAAAAAKAAAAGTFSWDQCLIVLVGDRASVLPQLAAAGFPAPLELGPDARAAR